jgi:C1A family cysteine protease
MFRASLLDGGWSRDLPDHRDYTRYHRRVQQMLRPLVRRKANAKLPDMVDWREYFGPVEDQGDFATSCANACTGLIQYFERRATGKLASPSRLFLHINSQRLSGWENSKGGASLRNTLKAAVRFGLPHERYWPYRSDSIDHVPDAFVYGSARQFRRMRYVRLDAARQTGGETLSDLKSFLTAGFACVAGFGIPSSIGCDAEIPYPTLFDSLHAGQAIVIAGYDDRLRVRSEKGALLIRSSWGTAWGVEGYGWLPYRYVLDRVAADIWTLTDPRWLRSGEFERPNFEPVDLVD